MDTTEYWNKKAKELIGLRIEDARYATHEEAADFGLDCRGLLLFMSDGTIWTAAADDEFNGFGTFTQLGAWKNLPDNDSACSCFPLLS
jgi:hypothetical protein